MLKDRLVIQKILSLSIPLLDMKQILLICNIWSLLRALIHGYIIHRWEIFKDDGYLGVLF